MADESEGSAEVGVWISMETFMEILDHMMSVCVILQDAIQEATDELTEEHPILSLVKKTDPERGH